MRSFVLIMLLFASSAQALTWDKVWKNQDQQAYQALTQNNFKEAAMLFKDPEWQGIAYYRMGDYQKALQAFMQGKDATAWYNSGNALAYLGQYQEAIRAYDQALTLNTDFEDARFNKALLQQLANNQTTASAPSSPSSSQTVPPFKRRYENKKNASASQATSSTQDNMTNTVNTSNTTPNTTQPTTAPQENSSQNSNTSPSSAGTSTPNNANPNDANSNSSNTYQNQQQQQSLQNMNDDPGGLLQRKLSRDYEQSQQQGE